MTSEPTATIRSIPAGYSFVPKGNVYITGNCRRQALGAHDAVYVVVNSKNEQIGIAVPHAVHQEVRRMEVETRAERTKNVEKRDATIEKEFDKVIREEFPHMPAATLPRVLSTALKKGKGKVGRTSTLSMRQKAHLAVRAHIRHCHTPYDRLMGVQGGSLARQKAREAVQSEVDSIARCWRGQATPEATKKPAARLKTSTCTEEQTVARIERKPGIEQRVLPLRLSGAKVQDAQRDSDGSRTFIDLTRDDSPDSDARSEDRTHEVATQAHVPAVPAKTKERRQKKAGVETAVRNKKPKATKKKHKKKPVRPRPGRPGRITRSMQNIEQSISELVKRLPDSPEPQA